MTKYCIVLLYAFALAVVPVAPSIAAPGNSLRTTGPTPTSGVVNLNPPDPQRELRHLSKDLKLKKDQRTGVGFILQERTREIHLLNDIEPLSEEYRDTLAAKVIQDSDAQIESLLRSKQKRKFDKELSKDREMR